MSDNLEKINCPACGKLMTKIYIKDKNVYLDVCLDGCGGIFFDNREFKMFDEEHESANELFETIKDKTFNSVDETEIRVCPTCGMNMVKNYSSIKNTIQVDDCYGCGAKFLDNSELEKIRAEYKTDKERTADVEKQFFESTFVDENGSTHQMKDLLIENKLLGSNARTDKTNADRLANFIQFIKNSF